jgi:hypothetical protein
MKFPGGLNGNYARTRFFETHIRAFSYLWPWRAPQNGEICTHPDSILLFTKPMEFGKYLE